MSWHVDGATLERFVAGEVDRVGAASIEAHVASCPDCRALVPSDRTWLDASWAALVRQVVAPRVTLAERVLHRVGVPAHVARLAAAPTAAGRSWLLAMVAALAVAVGLAHAATGPAPVRWLLVVAPLAPVSGVAVAYGRTISATHELELSTPLEGFRLLLLRTAAVTTAALALALLAGLAAVPAAGWSGAWLLPSLSLVAVTLALGTRVSLPVAAATVTTMWVAVVAVATSAGSVLAAFGAVAQSIHLGVFAVAAVVLARRWWTFDVGASR